MLYNAYDWSHKHCKAFQFKSETCCFIRKPSKDWSFNGCMVTYPWQIEMGLNPTGEPYQSVYKDFAVAGSWVCES